MVPIEDQRAQPEVPTRLFKDDTRFALGRIAVFQYTAVVAFFVLTTGFWVLQVRDEDFNSELAEEFWRAVSSSGGFNLHVVLHHGRNVHHIIEGIFKATARALRQAVEVDPRARGIPSTKGIL